MSPWRGLIFSAMQNILKKRISTTLRWLTSMWRRGKSQRKSSKLSSYLQRRVNTQPFVTLVNEGVCLLLYTRPIQDDLMKLSWKKTAIICGGPCLSWKGGYMFLLNLAQITGALAWGWSWRAAICSNLTQTCPLSPSSPGVAQSSGARRSVMNVNIYSNIWT